MRPAGLVWKKASGACSTCHAMWSCTRVAARSRLPKKRRERARQIAIMTAVSSAYTHSQRASDWSLTAARAQSASHHSDASQTA
jgi:hypothetical protein